MTAGEVAPGIRVAIVDDHPLFRLGVAAMLGTLPGIEVVTQAASAAEAHARIDDTVDVVLMDLHLGEDSGIETTRDLLRSRPDLRILVVTMLEDDESVIAAVRAGARGYLLKSATPAEIERAVRAVANGEVLLGPQVAARALAQLSGARSVGRDAFPDLTDREREILDLMARGHDTAGMSRRLVLSPKTVRNHVANVVAKLGVADRTAAVLRAREAGLGGD
ncbi:response regulator [Kineococcus gynurae]|uniref:Response regulator n=1 Tax=Kineococcus gynurae TaxID=452979 RepID=A0ABV5LS67_9ACTN